MDHETTREFYLDITATDHGSHHQTADTTITIYVSDVNDNPPTFQQSVYNTEIEENLPRGTFLIQVSASDPDTGTKHLYYGIYINELIKWEIISKLIIHKMHAILSFYSGANAALTYLIPEGLAGNLFSIDAHDGTIRCRQPLDREDQSSWSITGRNLYWIID